jgi:hypothetical protein
MTRRSTATRVGFGVADQAIASLATFLLGVGVARNTTQEQFGAFSIAFSAYLVLLVTARALVSEPFLVRGSGQSPRTWHRMAAAASGATLLVSLIGSAAFMAIGLVTGGLIGSAIIGFAFVVPAVLLADSWRFVLIADARPAAAFTCNVAWTSLFVAGLVAIGQADLRGLAPPLIAWGGAAVVGAVLGGLLARTLPRPPEGLAYIREHRDLGPRYVAEALIAVVASQVIIIVVGIAAGLAASAALRGAQILLGPVQILFMGIVIVGVPEGVRIARRGVDRLRRPAVVLSVALAIGCLALAMILPNLPSDLGEALLGPTWPGTQEIVGMVALGFAGLVSGTGAGIGLRVLADARRSLRARTAAAAAQTVGGVGGAGAAGLTGAVTGLAVGSWLSSVFMWWAFVASLRARPGDTNSIGVEGTQTPGRSSQKRAAQSQTP